MYNELKGKALGGMYDCTEFKSGGGGGGGRSLLQVILLQSYYSFRE